MSSSNCNSSEYDNQHGREYNSLEMKDTNRLVSTHVEAYDQRVRAAAVNISAEGTLAELREFYNENAEEYEAMRSSVQAALGWQALAEVISAAVPDKNARLLDCGAGTGGAGKHVLQAGFTNIDALEPSSSMLEIARQKNVYSHFFCVALDPYKQVDITDGTYDAVFISAGFLPGHIDIQHLPELCRILKPGGKIIFNVSDKYMKGVEAYKNGKLDSTLQSFKNDGVFENVSVQRGAYRIGEECNIYTIKIREN